MLWNGNEYAKTKVMRISRSPLSVLIKIGPYKCRIRNISTICVHYNKCLPIPVTARSKAWVCSHLLAGIAGSNFARSVDPCLLCVWCQIEISARADPSSVSHTECVCH
jgi:hypothetical protein